jgi:hypothetical protein
MPSFIACGEKVSWQKEEYLGSAAKTRRNAGFTVQEWCKRGVYLRLVHLPEDSHRWSPLRFNRHRGRRRTGGQLSPDAETP